jgi:hypothetical protein
LNILWDFGQSGKRRGRLTYDTFITAGGMIWGEFALKAGETVKALVRIGGSSILERTVAALRGSGAVGRIALVAPAHVRDLPGARDVDHFIPADADGAANIWKGLQHFSGSRQVILCTSDLPFIREEGVRDFLRRCPPDAAICYPIFEKEEIDPRIRPGVPSFIKLRDGSFTGGSIFRLDTSLCISRFHLVKKAFEARKDTLGMASLLGIRVIIGFLLGRCSLGDLTGRVSRLVGGECAAVRGCDPAITVDVDDLESYNFALRYQEMVDRGEGCPLPGASV